MQTGADPAAEAESEVDEVEAQGETEFNMMLR